MDSQKKPTDVYMVRVLCIPKDRSYPINYVFTVEGQAAGLTRSIFKHIMFNRNTAVMSVSKTDFITY